MLFNNEFFWYYSTFIDFLTVSLSIPNFAHLLLSLSLPLSISLSLSLFNFSENLFIFGSFHKRLIPPFCKAVCAFLYNYAFKYSPNAYSYRFFYLILFHNNYSRYNLFWYFIFLHTLLSFSPSHLLHSDSGFSLLFISSCCYWQLFCEINSRRVSLS